MDIRDPDGTPDHLNRQLRKFLASAGPGKSVFDAGDGIVLGTSIGPVRKTNEDRAIVVRARYARTPERDFLLAILSDGMGGMVSGETAAILAVSTFATRTIRSGRLPADQRLEMAAMAANEAVHQLLGGRGGATLSAVLIEPHLGNIGVNVGDSRIYLLPEDGNLEQISRDDTLGEYLKSSDLAADDLGSLVQFIGFGSDMEPHLLPIQFRNSNRRFILTSDGIHANNPMLPVVTREARSPRELIDRLLKMSEFTGGRDNATAVTVPDRFDSDPQRRPEIGLILECHSPTRTLEIWIPELLERGDRNGHAHGSHTDQNLAPQMIEPERQESPPLPGVEQKTEGQSPTPKQRRGRSRKAKKPPQQKAAGPKLEDREASQPKIEFPKDDQM
jgi:serine/threonine protein phosphatase PrpC